MWLVIDVQPQHLMFSSHFDGLHNELAANSLTPMIGIDASVEDECVGAAVPRKVDEAHQPIPVISANVTQASREDGVEADRSWLTPGGCPQRS